MATTINNDSGSGTNSGVVILAVIVIAAIVIAALLYINNGHGGNVVSKAADAPAAVGNAAGNAVGGATK
jgi:hypothetical protein